MRCQHCNQNEATTFIKKNINGHKEEMHLCSECAKELGVMDEFRMPSMSEMFGDSFLGNFLGAGVAAMNSLAGVDRCQTCGSSFNDIVQSGRMGCADCYDKFEDKLEPSLRKMQVKQNISANSYHTAKKMRKAKIQAIRKNKRVKKANLNLYKNK